MRVLIVLLLLSGCVHGEKDLYKKVQPSSVELVEGGVPKITLTPEAFNRLGIKTLLIAAHATDIYVPNSSLLYDNQGGLWVYVMGQALSFERYEVILRKTEESFSLVSFSSKGEFSIVTEGAAELFGTESGVGK